MISWLREKLALGFMFMARGAEHLDMRDIERLEQEHDYYYNQKENTYDVFH